MRWQVAVCGCGLAFLAFMAFIAQNPASGPANAVLKEASSVGSKPTQTGGPADIALAPELLQDDGQHIADTDLEAFAKMQAAKDAAVDKLPAAAFHEAEHQCATSRKDAALQCGSLYCAAKSECDDPCEEPYGQPPEQVVPLQPGTPDPFHKVAEVKNKELDAKEKRAKELHAKELAAKEKAAKEVDYKAKVAAEQQAKLAVAAEEEAKEGKVKTQVLAEAQTKEASTKESEKTRKMQLTTECTGEANNASVACEERVAQEQAEKAAELKQKADEAEAESATKELERKAREAKEVSDKAAAAQREVEVKDAARKATTNATANATANSTADTTEEDPCAVNDAETCITTFGCFLNTKTNTCQSGNAAENAEAESFEKAGGVSEESVEESSAAEPMTTNATAAEEEAAVFPKDGGRYRFVNAASSRMPYADTGTAWTTAYGATTELDAKNDVWYVHLQHGGGYRLVNMESQRALFAQLGESWSNGVGAAPPDTEHYADQVWNFVPNEDETAYQIRNKYSSRPLYAQRDKTGSDGFGAGPATSQPYADTFWHIEEVEDSDAAIPPCSNCSPDIDGFLFDNVWKGCYSSLKAYQTVTAADYGQNRMMLMHFSNLPDASTIQSATLHLTKTWDGSHHGWSCPYSTNQYELQAGIMDGFSEECDSATNAARSFTRSSPLISAMVTVGSNTATRYSMDITAFVVEAVSASSGNTIAFSFAGAHKGCLSAFHAMSAADEADRPVLQVVTRPADQTPEGYTELGFGNQCRNGEDGNWYVGGSKSSMTDTYSSVDECAVVCTNSVSCKYFGFHVEDQQCEFFTHDANCENDMKVTTSEGHWLFEKQNMDAHAFTVTSGPCETSSNGACIESSNYPASYSDSEHCDILAEHNITQLQVEAFDTEGTYDKLVVDGVEYHGTAGPQGVALSPGSTVTWTSDHSVSRGSWKVCAGPKPTPTVAPAASTGALFSVTDGSCQISSDGNCVSSPNYPAAYDDTSTCTIQALRSTDSLSVHQFDTETCCDKLTIGSTEYKGSSGPDGVSLTSGTVLSWYSDKSVTKTGWQICGAAIGVSAVGGTPAPTPCVTEPNANDQGAAAGDLSSMYATSVEECSAACTANERCAAFVYGDSSAPYMPNHCWLKERVTVRSFAQGYTFGERCDATPTPAPTTDSMEQPMFAVTLGDCLVSANGQCVSSPNYPGSYSNDEACAIVTQQSTSNVKVEEFHTEECCDKLTVDGVDYAGDHGPAGISLNVGASLSWRSDHSSTHGGWQICAEPDTAPVLLQLLESSKANETETEEEEVEEIEDEVTNSTEALTAAAITVEEEHKESIIDAAIAQMYRASGSAMLVAQHAPAPVFEASMTSPPECQLEQNNTYASCESAGMELLSADEEQWQADAKAAAEKYEADAHAASQAAAAGSAEAEAARLALEEVETHAEHRVEHALNVSLRATVNASDVSTPPIQFVSMQALRDRMKQDDMEECKPLQPAYHSCRVAMNAAYKACTDHFSTPGSGAHKAEPSANGTVPVQADFLEEAKSDLK